MKRITESVARFIHETALSGDEGINKFKVNAALVLDSGRIGEVLKKVLQLDRLERIDGLIACLNPS